MYCSSDVPSIAKFTDNLLCADCLLLQPPCMISCNPLALSGQCIIVPIVHVRTDIKAQTNLIDPWNPELLDIMPLFSDIILDCFLFTKV